MGIQNSYSTFKRKVDIFFTEDEEKINSSNWALLKPMSFLYLITLIFYFIIVCFYQNIPAQNALSLIAIVGQALFVAVRMLLDDKSSPKLILSMILFFAIEILVYSMALSLVVFPDQAAIIFPLSLILMTQIYTLRPVITGSIVLVSSIAFLTLSFFLKEPDAFILDVISCLISLSIGFIAIFTSNLYKANAYEAQKELNRISFYDDLTGLKNKHAFTVLSKNIEREASANVGLVFVDVNNLKRINDYESFKAGDSHILKCVDFLAKSFDPAYIYRYNGDEFVIVQKGIDEKSFNDRVLKLKENNGNGNTRLLSIGCAWTQICFNIQLLIRDSEKAMYEDKKEFYMNNPHLSRRISEAR